MINLLPEKEKIALRKEYRLRFIIVAEWMLLIVILGAAVLMAPSYLLSYSKRKSTESIYSKPATEKQQEYIELNRKITSGKALISLLKPVKPPLVVSDLIAVVTKHHVKNAISVTDIFYAFTEPSTTKIQVRGIAKTRQNLIDFKSALEQEPSIEKADFPVANLAKDSNIDFTLTLTIRTPK
jgi:hypothetical protein